MNKAIFGIANPSITDQCLTLLLSPSTGKPWTFQYFGQQLLTKTGITPTLFNGCCFNKETLSRIEEVGFKAVQAEKTWLNWSPEMFTGFDTLSVWSSRFVLSCINSVIFGFAEKEAMR